MIDREGNYSIDGWADGSYHESFAVNIALAEMRSDEYDDNYHKDKMIEYRGHDMDNEGVLHTSHTIHIHQIPDSVVQIENNTNYGYLTPDEFGIFRDPEGQARAMDGQVLNISKEDVADIIAMNGPRSFFHTENRAFDQTSIFETSSPSIDSHRELRRKVYDQNSRRKICWERKDEYGIYRDKDVYARAPDGRIIHVSREGIRAILERSVMVGHIHISLQEYAEVPPTTVLEPNTYSRTEIDELVEGIYRAIEERQMIISPRGSMISTTSSTTV